MLQRRQRTVNAVHQFVPVLEPGAVGAHLLEVRRVAHGLGLESEVYADTVHPAMAGKARDYRSYRHVAGDALLYQLAIGSVVGDFVLGRPGPVVVNSHNVTPVRDVADWEPDAVYGLSWGRAQLAAFAAKADLGIAVSRYNARELDAAGFRRTTVVPVLVDVEAFERDVDEAAVTRLTGPSAWLFVGRVAPHKSQHDLIKAFAVYRRVYDPAAVLRIVGAPSSAAYDTALRSLADALGVAGAVEITGGVGAGELAAHYRAADAFVCLSEHEGFCVPLLEAMHHRLPIVAFASTAVPETVADAGLLLPQKGPATVAAAVHRVLSDAVLRAELVGRGTARLADFALHRTRSQMADALCSVVEPG